MAQAQQSVSGEYEERGDYHRELDPKWKYYPVYVEKMALLDRYLTKNARNGRTIDLGCGEGLLVEQFHRRGFDIVGLDANYQSNHVLRGDITNVEQPSESFDTVLSLDVIEHLDFEQQEQAIAEIHRILKPTGRALLTIPNLAHFASRVSFALTGRLLRTSTIDRHKGDRPQAEYIQLIRDAGLEVTWKKGLFPTLPLISVATWLNPGRSLWMHRIYNRLPIPASWCFLSVIEVRKKERHILSLEKERTRLSRTTGKNAYRAA